MSDDKKRTALIDPPEFFPKGAIAFFVAMLVSFGLIWVGMYLLLVHRQLGL